MRKVTQGGKDGARQLSVSDRKAKLSKAPGRHKVTARGLTRRGGGPQAKLRQWGLRPTGPSSTTEPPATLSPTEGAEHPATPPRRRRAAHQPVGTCLRARGRESPPPAALPPAPRPCRPPSMPGRSAQAHRLAVGPARGRGEHARCRAAGSHPQRLRVAERSVAVEGDTKRSAAGVRRPSSVPRSGAARATKGSAGVGVQAPAAAGAVLALSRLPPGLQPAFPHLPTDCWRVAKVGGLSQPS